MTLNGEFLTIEDMAIELGLNWKTVEKRLFYKGLKPITKKVLYEASALSIIADVNPKGFQPGNKAHAKKTTD